MDYEHLDFPAAVRKLAARAGVPVIEERGAESAMTIGSMRLVGRCSSSMPKPRNGFTRIW